jgi:hypothetical protein
MIPSLVAPSLLLACVAASTILLGRAQRTLTIEQKAALLDASASRSFWFLLAIALLISVFGLVSAYSHASRWLLTLFIGLAFLLMIAFGLDRLRRLSSCGLPASYIRTVRLGTCIVWLGMFLAFASLTYLLWRSLP